MDYGVDTFYIITTSVFLRLISYATLGVLGLKNCLIDQKILDNKSSNFCGSIIVSELLLSLSI